MERNNEDRAVFIRLQGEQGEPAGRMTVTAGTGSGREIELIADGGNSIDHYVDIRHALGAAPIDGPQVVDGAMVERACRAYHGTAWPPSDFERYKRMSGQMGRALTAADMRGSCTSDAAGPEAPDMANIEERGYWALLVCGAFWALFGGLLSTSEPFALTLAAGVLAVACTTWAGKCMFEMARMPGKE